MGHIHNICLHDIHTQTAHISELTSRKHIETDNKYIRSGHRESHTTEQNRFTHICNREEHANTTEHLVQRETKAHNTHNTHV